MVEQVDGVGNDTQTPHSAIQRRRGGNQQIVRVVVGSIVVIARVARRAAPLPFVALSSGDGLGVLERVGTSSFI